MTTALATTPVSRIGRTPGVVDLFESITFNFKGPVRYDTLEGREYLVVPMVMLTEGVHQGSRGPLYYPKEELRALPVIWNHKPIVVYHPQISGRSVSACDPVILNSQKVGLILNTKWDERRGKLRAEAWVEKDRLNKIDARVLIAIENNQLMEVSTGLFTDNEQKEGEFGGKKYMAIARNYRPDHLAILPDKTGACSVADGAGLLQMNQREPSNHNHTGGIMTDQEKAVEQVYNARWPAKKRHSLPKDDFAGPHESFPIKDQEDVRHAASLAHHAADPAAVKRRIKSIAKRKGLKIPKSWREEKPSAAATTTIANAVIPAITEPAPAPVVNQPVVNAKKKMMVSHGKIRDALHQKLREKHGYGHYPEEVYDNFLIYSTPDGNLKKLGYSLGDEGNIDLDPTEPLPIQQYKEYRTMDGKYVGNTITNKKDTNMSQDKDKGAGAATIENQVSGQRSSDGNMAQQTGMTGGGSALSHSQLKTKIGSALGAGNKIHDVFDDFFVYGSDTEEGMKKVPYTVDANGNVIFKTEQAVPVTKATHYREQSGSSGIRDDGEAYVGSGSIGGEGVGTPSTWFGTMQRNEAVSYLITNKVWADGDRDFLMGLSDERFAKLVPPPKPKPQEVRVDNVQRKPVTVKEYVANAPPEVCEVLEEGLDMRAAKKAECIKTITENKGCVFTKDELEAKPLKELKGIVSLLEAAKPPEPKRPANYSGAGTILNSQTTANEAAPKITGLKMPKMEFPEAKRDLTAVRN